MGKTAPLHPAIAADDGIAGDEDRIAPNVWGCSPTPLPALTIRLVSSAALRRGHTERWAL
jgi:hypothetical protein